MPLPGYPKVEPFDNAYPDHLICRVCHEGAEVIVHVLPVERELFCKECLPEEYRGLLEAEEG